MNGNRISYIDNLKGIAILFVVMGHVVEKGIGLSDTPFNRFYASFHMPLFMFLSGVFAYQAVKQCCMAEYMTFYKKKFLRIMVPFVVIGGVFCIDRIVLYGRLGRDNWRLLVLACLVLLHGCWQFGSCPSSLFW